MEEIMPKNYLLRLFEFIKHDKKYILLLLLFNHHKNLKKGF